MHRYVQSIGWTRCVGSGRPANVTVAMLLVALFVSSAPVAAFQYHTSVDTELSTGSVTGPGGAASLVDETLGYRADIRVTGHKDDDGGSQLMSFGLSVGSDLGMGTRAVAVTNLKWEKTSSNYRLRLGDVMESFSQYSLSSSFKGLSYTHTLRGLELMIAGGYAYPRWENLYAGSEIAAVQREVKGVRLAYGVASPSGGTYGASIVSSTDRSGIKPGDKLYDNVVLSCDTEFRPIPGLTVRAVAASSDTSEKTRAMQAGGNAIKIDARSAAKQGRATFEYERATPGFMAVMGSAVADREKVKLRITSNHTKTVTSTIGYMYTKDNLENQKAQTTISNKPEVSVNVRRLLNRRYANLGAALKYNFQRTGDGTADGRTMSLDYRDRFGPVDTSFSVSKDSSGTILSETEGTSYLLELSSRAELGTATLRPTLMSSLTTDRNHLTAEWKQTTDMAVDLRVDLSPSNINSSLRVGQETSIGSSTSPKRIYGDLSVYYRPGFLASRRDGRIYLRANHAGYTHADASQDRVETSVKMGVSLSW